jgi:protein-disulfide isomerase
MLELAPDLAVPVTDVDHAIGPPTAPVTMVEYGDYECPSCLNAQPVVRQLLDRFGDRLRVVFRHFPQSGVHPRASAAAEAAEAAGGQGRFWDMHDALYKHHQRLADIDLTHLALKLGLDVYKFQQATSTGLYAPRVRADHDGGTRSGMGGTPAFFLNGKRYRGPVDVDSLAAAIDQARGV